MTARAKLRCSVENIVRYTDLAGSEQRNYEFLAQYDDTIPEDQRYAKATPTAKLTMTVDNPNVWFQPGKSYYLDITPVEVG